MVTRTALVLAAATLGFSDLAQRAAADIVHIRVLGTVEWNQFPAGVGLLGGIPAGSPAVMEMDVDSTNFVNSPQYPCRGYPPVPGTFSLVIGGVSVPLLGGTNLAYWVVRDNDPGADGFLFSSVVDWPAEVLLNIGIPGYGITFLRTFNGSAPGVPDPTLNSLDILSAQGNWGFENLSVYDFTIQRGEFSTPLGIIYERLRIEAVVSACNLADITNVGDTGAGPDNQLTLDDLLAFVNAFSEATGCPGSTPCNVADVTDVGDTGAGPDGQLTLDDILAFVNAFSEGC